MSSKLLSHKIFLLLIIINVAVYLVQVLSGIDWMNPALSDLIKWGANVAPLTLQGEPWRLFSSLFLHVGFIHIALNMSMLFWCGRIVEQAFDSFNFTLIYVISGLFSSLTSALWYAHHQVQTLDIFSPLSGMTTHLQLLVSAGASGALMGITGAYLAHWLVRHMLHSDKADAATLKQYGVFAQVVAINLVMGFMQLGVDNAAHVGGLISGAMLGGLLAIKPNNAAFSKRFGIALAISVVSLFLLYQGTHLAASDELKQLKTQLFTELQDLQKQQNLAAEKARIAIEVAADAKLAAKPVDAKTAAGESIDLSQYLSAKPFITDLKLSADGKQLVILAGELDNALIVVDTQTKQVVSTIKGPKTDFSEENCRSLMCEGKGASAVLLSPDGRFAYVSSLLQNAVSVVDLKQQKVLIDIATGTFPRAMAISKNGQRAYVANGVDNTLSVLDLSANIAIASPIKLDGGTAERQPFGHTDGLWLANDDSQLWALDAVLNQIQVIDTATLKTVKIIALTDNYLRDAKVGADGYLWIVGSTGIDVINPKTVEYDKKLAFCRKASFYHIATSSNKKQLAIAEDDGGYAPSYVHLINTSTSKTIGRYPITGPQNPLFSLDGKQIYVLGKQRNDAGNAKFSLNILTVDKTLDVTNDDENSPELLCQPN